MDKEINGTISKTGNDEKCIIKNLSTKQIFYLEEILTLPLRILLYRM